MELTIHTWASEGEAGGQGPPWNLKFDIYLLISLTGLFID